MNYSTFNYVTYIGTAPEKLWDALTNKNSTQEYWFGRRIHSDWKEGAPVTFHDENDVLTDQGILLNYEPNRLLSYTFLWVEDQTEREQAPKVTFTLQPMKETVKLTLKHQYLLPTDFYDEDSGFQGINNGWPAILSNLKTLLETGNTLPAVTIES